jgi:hypothetical protein
MTKQATPDSSFATQIPYYVIIAISAVFILFPAMRTLPFARLVVSILVFATLIVTVRRGMKSGALGLSLPKVYAQAKDGRRFVQALETATVVAATIAFWMTI